MMGTSQQKSLFTDYEGFLGKFEPKKTTDDCYTPANIYEVIADYVQDRYGVAREDMVRPFYPGGDYEAYDYPKGCCVVDNPPFSIITPICRTYANGNIKFFLFCPYLTAFQIMKDRNDICVIAAPVSIVYENGARVATCFITNMENGVYVRSDPDLYSRLDAVNRQNLSRVKKQLPKYEYPDDILTITKIGWLAINGAEFTLQTSEACPIYALDEQKLIRKDIFGNGFLLSEKATERLVNAKRIAQENLNNKSDTEEKIVFKLSDRERKIQKMLGSK